MHDQEPRPAEVDEQTLANLEQLVSSGYAAYVRQLLPAIKAERVVSTITGNSGFVLRLQGLRWIAVFLQSGCLHYSIGSGDLPSGVRDRLNSTECGDPGMPLIV